MSLSSIKSKKELVLNETIAQSIQQELKELLSDPGQGRRCLLELIQNSADAALDKVDAEIVRQGSKVTFSHNGRSFSDEELLKLVYHGSTKGETDEKSGKLGTGFLASHLISMRVKVSSSLEGKLAFSFKLDREAQDAKALSKKMQNSWNELEEQLSRSIAPTDPKTSYEYEMTNESQQKAYESGLILLKKTAPIILAFDERINSIKVNNNGQTEEWRRDKQTASASGSKFVTIARKLNEKLSEEGLCHFILKDEENTSVAIASEIVSGKLSFADMSDHPKLYYPLPFVDTSGFPFPAIVSDRGFLSTRARETPSLTNATPEDVEANKQRAEISFRLMAELLKEAIELGHEGRHNLGKLPSLAKAQEFFSKHQTDQDWLGSLVSKLIGDLGELPILLTPKGYATPNASKIPLLEEEKSDQTDLWKLVSKFFPDSVPIESLGKVWGEIERGWGDHCKAFHIDSNFEELVTLDTLTDIVNSVSDLDDLQSKLGDANVLNWVDDLLKLIQATDNDKLLDTKKLLPTQANTLALAKDLYLDPGIAEELKTISSKLEYEVREELLHKDLAFRALPKSLTEATVLLKVLELVEERAKTHYTTDDYQTANFSLFNWLVKQDKIDKIRESFPAITREKEDNEKEYVRSFTNETKFFSPPSTWDVKDRPYADVFPSRAILSEVYSSVSEDNWKKLEENGLILRRLLTQDSEHLGSKEMRALSINELSEDEKTTHSSKGLVSVATIPFMREKDWGIFDRVGDSRRRAQRLLAFVMRNLVKSDLSWKQELDVLCSCGSNHNIRPCLWLSAMSTRQWVPVAGGVPEGPNSENLAQLFNDEGFSSTLDEDSSDFLAVLGINVGAILMVNKTKSEKIEYEKAVGKLVVAARMDPDQISQLAKIAADEDALLAADQEMKRKDLVHGNQKVGEIVETIVREELKKAFDESEFSVTRTPVMSDIKIEAVAPNTVQELLDSIDYESDLLDESGREVLLNVTMEKVQHLIEVKSARQKDVKMTVPQARKALSLSSSYSLCVVPVDSSIAESSVEDATKIVRMNARFVYPIGDKLSEAVKDIDSFLKGETARMAKPPQDVEAAFVGETQPRVKIREPVWDKGLEFGAFVNFLVSNRGTALAQVQESVNQS